MMEPDEEFGERIPMTWFRCRECFGLLPSIPKFEKHWENEHPFAELILPDNLPPGAKEGIINYEPDYSPVAQLPYSQLIAKWVPPVSSAPPLLPLQEPISDPNPEDFGIRLRQLEDLTEKSEDEENVNPANEGQQRKDGDVTPSPPGTPLVSPPDSGIQVGSEVQEEEAQQRRPSQIISLNVGVPEKRTYASVASSTPKPTEDAVPSSSTATEKPVVKEKLKCPNCNKKFNNFSALNFHLKKFHPVIESSVAPVIDSLPEQAPSSDTQLNKACPAKGSQQPEPILPASPVILTIQKDSTGNFTSRSGGNAGTSKQLEGSSVRQLPKRVRQTSISSEVSDCTTVAPPRKVRKTLPEILRENQTKEKEADPVKIHERQVIHEPEVVETSEKQQSKKPKLLETPAKQPESSAQTTGEAMEVNESASDSEVENTKRVLGKRRPKRIESSSHSGSDSDGNAKSETTEVLPSPPNTRKRTLRKRATKPERFDASIASPPKPRYQTRGRGAKKKKPPTPSPSESESSNEESSHGDTEEDISDNSEEEMSEKSTTTNDESLPPSDLTNYENSDEDTKKKKTHKPQRKSAAKTSNTKKNLPEEEEKVEENNATSGSDDDLFEEVKVPKKKKNKQKSGESKEENGKKKEKGEDKDSEEKDGNKKKKSNTEHDKSASKPNQNPVAGPSSIKCKFCTQRFTDAFKYIKHIYDKHKNDPLVYDCGRCKMKFKTTVDSYDDYENHECLPAEKMGNPKKKR